VNRPPELTESSEVQPSCSTDPTVEPFKVGDPIPVRLGILDMCRLFPINGRVMNRGTFHRLERAGKFRRFELPHTIGHKAWSGYRVAKELTGDSFSIAIKKVG
jgi:hypothetical protein